ncbi:MAG: repressor LexA [Verrucomicrobiaceae bacterium]|nr:repressor LexA [Verrucomicrobiaceae bacterium]
MTDLTKPQNTLLRFLEERARDGLSPPTIREICAEMGYQSTRAASDLIDALERKGYIKRDGNKARSIQILRRSDANGGVPLLGSVAAGFPDTRESLPAQRLDIDPRVFGIPPSHRAFALRVSGDSMIGKHMFDGDIVVCDGSASPQSGDVVAALIDQQSTLKTLVKKGARTWLKAENPAYPDLFAVSSLLIQGVARGVFRSLLT